MIIVKSSSARIINNSFNTADEKVSHLRQNDPRAPIRRSRGGKGKPRSWHQNRQVTYASLSNIDKRFICAHPERTVREVADMRNLAAPMVKALRQEDAIRLLKTDFPAQTDANLAGRVGISCDELRRIRKSVGLYRLRGRARAPHKSGNFPSKLGTAAEVCYALTEGGMTVPDLIRRRKLNISRQRGHNLVEDMGLVLSKMVRTPRWYASRIGHPELGDKNHAKILLKKARSVTNAARQLDPPVDPDKLADILRKHGLPTSRVRMKPITLRCAHCKHSFTVPGHEYRVAQRSRDRKRKFFCDRSCLLRYRWGTNPLQFRRKKA